MTRPRTLHTPDLHPPLLEPRAGVEGGPSMDYIDPRRVRPRTRIRRCTRCQDLLNAAQRRKAARILGVLRELDRLGATDGEIAAAADVPVEVVTAWRLDTRTAAV